MKQGGEKVGKHPFLTCSLVLNGKAHDLAYPVYRKELYDGRSTGSQGRPQCCVSGHPLALSEHMEGRRGRDVL